MERLVVLDDVAGIGAELSWRVQEKLKSLSQFFGKRTLWTLLRGRVWPLMFSTTTLAAGGGDIAIRCSGRCLTLLALRLGPGLRRLRLIGAQKPIFQRSTVETADDQVHFF